MKLNQSNSKHSVRGIAMTEYLILVAVVALGCVLAAGYFGQTVKGKFHQVGVAISGATPTAITAKEDTTRTGLANFGDAVSGSSDPRQRGNEGENHGGSGTAGDDLWKKFKEKLADNIADAASHHYEVNINSVLKSAAEDLDLSAAQVEEMTKKAAAMFARQGEDGAINAFEALQDVKSTLQRGEEASRAVAVFDVLEKGTYIMNVVGAVKDIWDIGTAIENSIGDPDHKHQHEGEAVGIAVGGAGAAAIIGLTAPVSVPVLIVGVLGATVVAIFAKPLFGWIGSQADKAKAVRQIVRLR